MKKRSTSFVLSATMAGVIALALAGCNRGADSNGTGSSSTGSTSSSTGSTLGTKVDDTALTASVKSALMADDTVRSFDIDVETNNGVVQLAGHVTSQAQIDQALKVARGVSGVREVENRLTVKPADATAGSTSGATSGATSGTTAGAAKGSASGTTTPLATAADDTAITARVKSALLAEPEISSLNISVETTHGVVQLTGNVDNKAQMDKAAKVAGAAEGAKSVKNLLKVKS